jgi:hypothetical protein
MALTRVDTHGCADLEANPLASSVKARSDEHPEPDVEMSESEALVSFAAAKLGASRPRCVLVTVA